MLTVSTLASLAAKWLLPRLTEFPGSPSRHRRPHHHLDQPRRLQRDNVDAAIRYGRGQWPGLRADWLMADELFPVCSPSLLAWRQAAAMSGGPPRPLLLHTSNANSDDWRLWLTAAGLPANIARQPGMTFDMVFMTIQAAIDGIGVAMGRTSYVQDDIAKGRLVVPFKIALPADAGFYLVSPEGRPRSAEARRHSGNG